MSDTDSLASTAHTGQEEEEEKKKKRKRRKRRRKVSKYASK